MIVIGIGVEIRDVLESDAAFQELIKGGKVDQVSCLRVRAHARSEDTEDRWIYSKTKGLKTSHVPAP